MPRIQVVDQNGYNIAYTIDSNDQETVARWLWETLHRLEGTQYHPAMIRIWPSFSPDGKPDWSPDMSMQFFAQLGGDTTADNVRGLIAALRQYADMQDALQKGGGS